MAANPAPVGRELARAQTASAGGAPTRAPASRRPTGASLRWRLEHHAEVMSTQRLARELPAWAAVWADVQTAGRGQAERTFVSDAGGIYLTAVLPYSGDVAATRGFALAVGWAVRRVLRRAGFRDVRLRWPNDLMVGTAKVGGILVEQGAPDTLLVGLGLNLTNAPWMHEAELQGIAGRLADANKGRPLPERVSLVRQLLGAIGFAHREFARRRLAGFATLLTRCWGEAREVVLEPARGVEMPVARGCFLGITAEGAVRLKTATGAITAVPAHHVARLREV
jgi:BirA family biotin operon repressor/biotin-[acetyl-CoA-carboxylase] ligase